MSYNDWPPATDFPQSAHSPAQPTEPRVVVQVIGPDHPDHPNNRAKRAAAAAQKAAEEAAAALARRAQALAPSPSEAPQEPPVKKHPKRRKPRRTREPEPTCDRHGRKCAICAHEYRDEIEELFLDWRSPSDIASDLGVHLRTLYRHAHATGLYARRQGKLRTVLDRILERADFAHVNGDCIIRAVRAYSCLGRDNKWTEPPSRVIFSSEPRPQPMNAALPIEVVSARKLLPPVRAQIAPTVDRGPAKKKRATRRQRKNRARKSRVLIDTKTIRKPRISLKTRGRR
jgi:hypothetical protein